MWETWVRSLGWEDPLEDRMTIHASILAWESPWTEEPDGLYSPWGHKESDMTEWQSTAKKKKNHFLVTGNVSEGSKPVMLRPYVWWITSKRGLSNLYVWLLKKKTQTQKSGLPNISLQVNRARIQFQLSKHYVANHFLFCLYEPVTFMKIRFFLSGRGSWSWPVA